MKIQWLYIIIYFLLNATGVKAISPILLVDSSQNKMITFLKNYESILNKSINSPEKNDQEISIYFHAKNALIYNLLEDINIADSSKMSINQQSYLYPIDLLLLHKNVFPQKLTYQFDFNNISFRNDNVILLGSAENSTETSFYNVFVPVSFDTRFREANIQIKDTLNFDLNYILNTQNQEVKIEINKITKADNTKLIPFKSLPQPYIERLIIKQKVDSLMIGLNNLVIQKEDSTIQKKYLSTINTLIEPSGYFHILSPEDSTWTKIDARTFTKNAKNLAPYTFLKAKINHNNEDKKSNGICINTYHNVFFREEKMYFEKRTGLILYDKNIQSTQPGWWIYEVWLKQ